MDKNIRIRTTPGGGDKFIKVKLEQDFDFIEILSLKISQDEVYRKFCADYGVITGRVIANNGFGVPNAKISVFIPISDDDKENQEIIGLYPYEFVTDKNSNGVRYNLLTNEPQNECHVPVGTMPTKREILDNDILLEIFEKYYKFTTTTNNSGDYMIFGVPTGQQILHMDCDLSDLGLLTQRPYDMTRQGSTLKQFESPTKFKSGNNLDSLTQVKSSNIGVNVQPFWGDVDSCEVGISRVDFNIPYFFQPSAIFIGSLFSDNDKHSINKNCRPRKKSGDLCETVTSEGTIEMIRRTIDNEVERFDVEGGRVIDDDGTWSYQIPMNLDYMITDEFGNLVISEDPNKGVPTRAEVRFRVSMDVTGDEGRLRTRAAYLIPNNPSNINDVDYTFDETTINDKSFVELKWNKLYTVKNLITRYQPNNNNKNNRNFVGIKNVDDCGSHTPFPYNRIDTDINPLFMVICTMITILIDTIAIINSTIIWAMNKIIGAINDIIHVINKIIGAISSLFGGDGPKDFSVNTIECIPITIDTVLYKPGCDGSPNDKENLKNSLKLILGDYLNIFEFDFYNDWINGSLYFPLLKYKHKKNEKEKFCDYDCATNPDIDCNNAYILDTCIDEHNDDGSLPLNNGIIKKYNDELYYPSLYDNGLLYPTDILLLGSIKECDADGIPNIYKSLIPTTYQLPEYINDATDATDEQTMVPLFFDNISCIRFDVSNNNRFNINTCCELGIDLGNNSKSLIDNDNINDTTLRKQIICMNTPGLTMNDFTSKTDNFYDNSGYYYKHTGYNDINSGYNLYRDLRGTLNIPRGGSLFFYFGIIPGKSAIDKANSKFFTNCK
jgi:hypothetical protein